VSIVHDFFKVCYQQVHWLKSQMLVDVPLKYQHSAELCCSVQFCITSGYLQRVYVCQPVTSLFNVRSDSWLIAMLDVMSLMTQLLKELTIAMHVPAQIWYMSVSGFYVCPKGSLMPWAALYGEICTHLCSHCDRMHSINPIETLERVAFRVCCLTVDTKMSP
jgi:hypothetical protein